MRKKIAAIVAGILTITLTSVWSEGRAEKKKNSTTKALYKFDIPGLVKGKEAKKWIKKGKMVAMTTFKTMAKTLKKAVKKGGPIKAIKVCNTAAPKLAKKLGKKYGVEIYRVSHRPRNPNNKADELEMKIINGYIEALNKKQKATPIVVKRDKKLIFYAPIYLIYPLCTKCHGQPNKEISPKTLKVIKKLYPHDKATGFKIGELRGLWKIVVKK